MELEAHTQTHTATNEASDEITIVSMQDDTAPVRVAPVQHQEIPVSKNVQNDLDL